MRNLFLTTALVAFSSAAYAETFTLPSYVTAVTAYPQGATVTRTIMLQHIPEGSHRLLIGDIPKGFAPETLRIKDSGGLVIGAMGFRDDRLPPDVREVVEREDIEEEIDLLRDELRVKFDAKAGIKLRVDAANARITFLETMGNRQAKGAGAGLEGGNLSVETLQQMVALVGDETLKALQDAHSARVEMAAIERDIDDMQEDLKVLQQKHDAIALPPADRVIVSLDVTAKDAVEGFVTLTYVINNAGWSPVYDVKLDQGAKEITVDRQAMLYQYTGEAWDDVAVTVSTARPNYQLAAGELWAQRAYLYDQMLADGGIALRSSLAPAAPVMLEEAAYDKEENRVTFDAPTLDFQGLTAVYHLANPVHLDGDGAESLFNIDTASFDVTLNAHATPLLDESVYLYASLTNDSPVPYLPGNASFYRDGAFIGSASLPIVTTGETVDLAFGAIDGLTATRTTLFRETGESGIITTSNDREERYELTVENVTNQTWDITLYDRAPYSEEEDLEIDVTARPAPTTTDTDGKRGVYSWAFPLAAGGEHSIKFSYTIGWPEDKQLGVE